MAGESTHIQYGTDGSEIGSQLTDFWLYKKAIKEVAKEQFFGQMADTIAMPKHMGKTIKRYHYLPILDDRNINDQGIDAAGAIRSTGKVDVSSYITLNSVMGGKVNKLTTVQFRADATDAAKATSALVGKIAQWAVNIGLISKANAYTANSSDDVVNIATVLSTVFGAVASGENADGSTNTTVKRYSLYISSVVGTKVTKKQVGSDTVAAESSDISTAIGTLISSTNGRVLGNLYGSSKDPSYIQDKMPIVGELGGRKNRIGYTRRDVEGSFQKFGLFMEYTQEALDFDNDADLLQNIVSEATKTANQVYEDKLQIDILNNAGVLRYTGSATSMATLSGDKVTSGTALYPNVTYQGRDVVTYDDLMRLAIELDNNGTPKSTKIISGSRMVDTKTINAARYIYIGSELIPTLRRMKDLHGQAAFIDVRHYANAGEVAKGEVGAIDQFRFIVVPSMMSWAGAGAIVGDDAAENGGYRCSYDENGILRYDVFPMLVVGSESFTTIGFQTDGSSSKFVVYHKKPGLAQVTREDPFGESGIWSIKWFYGFMPLRPERIALIKTVAEM